MLFDRANFAGDKDRVSFMGITSSHGTGMNFTLSEEDRRAVDLLLDRSAMASSADGDGAASVYATADPSLGERVARAQKLLQLLDWLPAPEPSADLVARTVNYVEEAHRHGAVRSQLPNLLGSQRPVA